MQRVKIDLILEKVTPSASKPFNHYTVLSMIKLIKFYMGHDM